MAQSPPALSDARHLSQRFKRDELFRLARLADGENDDQRARAIRTLHELYRRQLVRWRQAVDDASLTALTEARKSGYRNAIDYIAPAGDAEGLLPSWSSPMRLPSREARAAIVDRQLEDLFDGIGLRIARSKNPVAAAKRLFEPKGKRGPKIKNDGRDFEIAVEIQRLENQEWTVEAAVAENARLEGVSESRVKQIVREQRAKWSPLGIRAEAALVERQAGRPASVKSQDR